MIAVVAGGTGLVGSALIEKLLLDKAVERVISISRRSLHIVNDKFSEVLITDLSELANPALFRDQLRGDTYFCCLGTTIKSAGGQANFRKVDFDAIVNFAKLAETAGARSFVLVSAMGADENSKFFYNKVKGETESAIRTLKIPSVSVFRPGLLVGERKEFRLAESVFINLYKPLSALLPAGLKKTIATNVDVLSFAMIEQGRRAAPGFHAFASKDI